MGIMSENEIGVTAMTGIRKFRGFPDQVEPSPLMGHKWIKGVREMGCIGVRGTPKSVAIQKPGEDSEE